MGTTEMQANQNKLDLDNESVGSMAWNRGGYY